MTPAEIHGAIRSRRVILGLSQSALSRLAGLSQQHLSLIESGRIQPSLGTLERILRALGLALSVAPAAAEATEQKLAGLRRFNAWEELRPPSTNLAEALELSESMARLYADLHGGGEAAVHLSFQSQAWKDWRRSLEAAR